MSNILSEISLYDTIYKLKDDNAVPTSRTVNGKALTSDIALSFSDVGADKSGTAATAEANAKTYADSTADNKISMHNTATDAHNDIRVLIADLKEQLENFLDVDDTTVDQLSEVLTLINNNKGTLESLTTTKVNVSDIINNLTTNSSNKVLSAAQGVAIKALIDALQSELDAHENNKSNPHGVTAEQIGAATTTQLNSLPKIYVQTNEPTSPKDGDIWVDTDDAEQTVLAAVATSGSFNDLINKPTYGISNITGLQTALDAKAAKADIAATKYAAASNSSAVYFKISDFGAWGSGAWYQKGFSMLISSRAGEMIWVAVSSDDSNTNAKAIRLLNTYGKILNIYYSTSESALYVKANAWCNNVCAHIISNLNGDYVANVAQASALASDAVEIKITEFGATSAGVAVGSSNGTLTLTGSGNRPTYNGTNVALQNDIPSLSGYATQTWVQQQIAAIAVYNGSVS